jgi:hypothetical protein
MTPRAAAPQLSRTHLPDEHARGWPGRCRLVPPCTPEVPGIHLPWTCASTGRAPATTPTHPILPMSGWVASGNRPRTDMRPRPAVWASMLARSDQTREHGPQLPPVCAADEGACLDRDHRGAGRHRLPSLLTQWSVVGCQVGAARVTAAMRGIRYMTDALGARADLAGLAFIRAPANALSSRIARVS